MITNEFSRTNYILTEGCNLNCDFCFQQETHRSSKQLTKDEIIKYTEFTLKNFQVEKQKDFNINIIGGEPLLYKDFSIMKEVIDMFFNKGITKALLTVFTNGTIWNESFIDFCKYAKNKVDKICIILNDNYFDDIPNRIPANKIETFKNNVNKIKRELPFVDIEISCIFDKTIKNEYERIIEHNVKNDVKKDISFAEYSKAEKNLTEKDFYSFTKTFLKVLKNNNIELLDDFCNTKKNSYISNLIRMSGLNYLEVLLTGIYIKEEQLKSCRPLVKEFGIAPGGYICPCSRALAFKHDFPNIYEPEEQIIDKLKKYTNKSMEMQSLSEEGQNCFKCLLKNNCLSCKIMPFGYIEKDGVFYAPKEKCKYQLDQFNGQYRAVKELIEENKK